MMLETNPDIRFLPGYNKEPVEGPLFPTHPETVESQAGVLIYVIERKDAISSSVAHLHERYDIPEDRWEELGVLVQNYLRSAHNLEAAHTRWQAHRGSHGWELEFQLLEETQDLSGLYRSLRDHDTAACALGGFLKGYEMKSGKKRKPLHVDGETIEFSPEKLVS